MSNRNADTCPTRLINSGSVLISVSGVVLCHVLVLGASCVALVVDRDHSRRLVRPSTPPPSPPTPPTAPQSQQGNADTHRRHLRSTVAVYATVNYQHNHVVTVIVSRHLRRNFPPLVQSDEVYDDGENYTILEYKQMADKMAKKWRAREPPAQKPRAAPRYEPMVRESL